MQKPWYQQSEADICTFFDVSLDHGLTQKEALKRLTHFGKNIDTTLPNGIDSELLVCVIRDAKKQYVATNQIVPGDVLFLREGDRIPADVRFARVNSLLVNQSHITGDVLPAAKNTFAVQAKTEPNFQKCIGFAGSYIVSGTATAIVTDRGIDTLQYQAVRPKRLKASIKGSVIARRLRAYGVIVLNKRSLAKFRLITHVCIDDDLSDNTIADIIRKVQLTRNIHCRFIVSEVQAKRLAREMNADIYDASSRQGNIQSALFITNVHTDVDNSVHIMKALQTKNSNILWSTKGTRATLALRMASLSLVTGRAARADVLLAADLFSPKQNSSILTRILYNKK
ncbi:MAG: cation-transporting P-type ATPase [Candidatus Saccharimonadales bacterium]